MLPPIIDETHDPARTSWVASANTGDTDFPLQNLPLGAFYFEGQQVCGVAIGDSIFNLKAAGERGLLAGLPPAVVAACGHPQLNALMALPPENSRLLRQKVFALFDDGAPNVPQREAVRK